MSILTTAIALQAVLLVNPGRKIESPVRDDPLMISRRPAPAAVVIIGGNERSQLRPVSPSRDSPGG